MGPEGCSEPAADGVTYGAGQGFLGLYQFAEDNNITFNNSPNQSTINRAFGTAHEVANILAGVPPNSGVYQNEADTFQDNHEQVFWGQENYDRLLSLKKEMDPNNILTCWQCIGYDASDPRYG